MTNEEKRAQIRRKLEQVLNDLPVESCVAPEILDEKPTYESIAAKLEKAEAGLAALNEKMRLQLEHGSEA